MRGKLGFASSQIEGKVMRGCEWPLLQRQYRDRTTKLTEKLRVALAFILMVLERLKPRRIELAKRERERESQC